MKFSTTVLLAVFVLPYLVNARPPATLEPHNKSPVTDLDITEKSPGTSSVKGQANDNPNGKQDETQRSESRSAIDDSIEIDKPRHYTAQSAGHKTDLDKPLVSQRRKGDLHKTSFVGPDSDKEGPKRTVMGNRKEAIDKTDLRAAHKDPDPPVGVETPDPRGAVDKQPTRSSNYLNLNSLGSTAGNSNRNWNSAGMLRRWQTTEPTAKRFYAHHKHLRPRLFSKRDAPSDIDILNFALTFEHLVSAFYKAGLERYRTKHFQEAGYEVWIRKRYEQLAKNGRTHVQFLESALGEKAIRACQYNLKDKDVKEWVGSSFVLENVAASAWNGVVGILQDRAYQTVAASIMGVKSRHAAWINSAVRKSNAWNTPFETPLDMNQIYSVISPFIIAGSCPSTNAPLRATPFPTLHVPPCHPGSSITLEFEYSAGKAAEKQQQQQLFAAFVSGTGTVFISMKEDRKVEVPKGLVGLVYVFVTRDGGKVGTEEIVAGPGVVWFGFRA